MTYAAHITSEGKRAAPQRAKKVFWISMSAVNAPMNASFFGIFTALNGKMHLQYEGHSEGQTQDEEPHNDQHEQHDKRTEAPEEDNDNEGREEGDDGRDARPEAPGDDTGPYGREH